MDKVTEGTSYSHTQPTQLSPTRDRIDGCKEKCQRQFMGQKKDTFVLQELCQQQCRHCAFHA